MASQCDDNADALKRPLAASGIILSQPRVLLGMVSYTSTLGVLPLKLYSLVLMDQSCLGTVTNPARESLRSHLHSVWK